MSYVKWLEKETYGDIGNILMLAEGRRGIDHNFSLSDGILRLEVNKATFERMGLEGKAMPSEGRQHVKARYGENSFDLN